MQSGERLRCTDLRVGYGSRAILPAIDVSLRAGELWAVVGRNGTGKSTWFRTLLGLIPKVSGELLRAPGLRISYAPQRAALDPMFPALARDVVAMATDRDWSFARPRLFEPAIVTEALEQAGAGAFAGRPFRTLSEGKSSACCSRA